MKKSYIFKVAHRVTKAAVKNGGDYKATFSLALKMVSALNKEIVIATVRNKLTIKRLSTGEVVFTAKDLNDFARNFRRNNENFNFYVSLTGKVVLHSKMKNFNKDYALYDVCKGISYSANTYEYLNDLS